MFLGKHVVQAALQSLSRNSRSRHVPRCYRNLHKSSILFGVDGILLRMPSLSPTMTEGVIVRWLKKEGDLIQPGDVLCEIQTDKAVVAFEVEEAGTLAKIIAPSGDKSIPINKLIGIMVEEGQDWRDVNVPVETGDESQPEIASAVKTVQSQPCNEVTPSTGPCNVNLLGPAVKLLLSNHGLDPSQVPASGPHRVLMKGDVLKFLEGKRGIEPIRAGLAQVNAAVVTKGVAGMRATGSAMCAEKPSAERGPPEVPLFRDVELTSMRRAIARRLSHSKATIPHSYSSCDVSVAAVQDLRKALAAEGTKVSVNDFIIKGVALALRKVPRVNAIWDATANAAQLLEKVDISVAVATDKGLITPIVTNADTRTVADIGETIRELAARARANKLKPHEFEGGSFSVSNLGMFGIKEFTAVINPPQAAIMAVGGGRDVFTSSRTVDTLMTVTVSFDARMMDDVDVGDFLEKFREVIEDPRRIATA